jgi:hypothetical protein
MYMVVKVFIGTKQKVGRGEGEILGTFHAFLNESKIYFR